MAALASTAGAGASVGPDREPMDGVANVHGEADVLNFALDDDVDDGNAARPRANQGRAMLAGRRR